MRGALGLVVVFTLMPCVAVAQGDPVGPEFRVNTYTTSSQASPSVAADSSGNFVVVWHSFAQDGALNGVFGQRYASSGIPLGPEFRVNTYTTSYQVEPSVATDPAGNFVVVWTSEFQDGSGTGIFGQRYANSGAPVGPEFRVNTYTTGDQGRVAVASGTSGNFVVVWQSDGPDGSLSGVFGQRYASSGAPLGSEFLVNTYVTNFQGGPAVAVDSSGNFIVAWRSFGQDGSYWGVFGQRYASSGIPLGPEFRVNTYTTGVQYEPSVATDTGGNFVVIWQSAGISGQRYAGSGIPLGPEFRVNTYTSSSQSGPSVAADPSGNLVVVWQSFGQDGSLGGVFGQRYATSGVPLGSEFRVNTYTTSTQGYFGPSVTADTSGRFVVIWDSNTEDGSAFGVFGQRYNLIVPVELMRFGVE